MATRNKPLYEVIYRQYKTRILSGQLKPGSRLPTEMEIALEYKVSRITVSRALKELELENFIERIKGSGTYVAPEKWKKSGQTAERSSGDGKGLAFISLILPFEGEFSSQYLQGIEDVARSRGYFVTLHNSADNPEREIEIIEEILTKGSHGIIVYPASDSINLHMYSTLVIRNYPFVILDRKIQGIDTSLVCADNMQGFKNITSHLIDLGHRRIIFAGTSVYSISSELERYRGFCQAHIEKGIPLMKKNLYSYRDFEEMPEDYMAGSPPENRIINYFLQMQETIDPHERPTAIAAVNDLLARQIMTTALERGLSIPGDYSLTGFDNLPYSPHLPVPLTTVEQPAYEIGKIAAEVLFRHIKQPEQPQECPIVPPSLIIRESAGKL